MAEFGSSNVFESSTEAASAPDSEMASERSEAATVNVGEENPNLRMDEANISERPVESGNDGNEGNVVFVLVDDQMNAGEATVDSSDCDVHAMSEADMLAIKTVIEEKKRLQREQLKQESLEDVETVSQESSLPSTPSACDKLVAFTSGRRLNRRRRKMGTTDTGGGKKFSFLNSVMKRFGRRSLRRSFAKADDNGDFGDTDHCYFSVPKKQDDGIANSNASIDSTFSKGSSNDFYRCLFVSKYDEPFQEAASVESQVNGEIVVDILEVAQSTSAVLGPAKDNEIDEALSEYLDTGSASLNDLDTEAMRLVTSVRKLLGQQEEMVEDDWKDRLFKLAETFSHRKLLEGVLKVLEEVYYASLLATGNPDEWMIRKLAVNQAADLLRLHFADGIASFGLPLICWAHCSLLEHVPPEICARYVVVLCELFYKAPELVTSIINSTQTTNRRVVELITSFMVERKRSNLSSELFFHQRPPTRLSKDPILMLVSPNMKAHHDNVAPGSSRCRYFYKNLFPHIGFCMEFKFTPFKKGMSIAACSDQLFALLRDKVREVQYYHSNRPIVLVGWQTSSLVALKIALEKSLAAVVCLGFPNMTLNGSRGGLNDELLQIRCPTLFVAGELASTCSIDELEEMRRNMKCERSGVIVVGGADNELKMSHTKLRSENLCQELVDRCVLESVGEFLTAALETYSPVEAGNGNLPGALLVKREGETSVLSSAKRRRSTVGLLTHGQLVYSGNVPPRKRSGIAANVPLSTDVSMDDHISSAGASSSDLSSTTAKFGEETNVSLDDNAACATGTTRTRQIRKPHLLDL